MPFTAVVALPLGCSSAALCFLCVHVRCSHLLPLTCRPALPAMLENGLEA